MTALQALLAGIVDYAGLFPPAALSMPEAVQQYAASLAGPQRWMLGRFVVPVANLADLDAAVERLNPSVGNWPWRLSGLLGVDLPSEAAALRARLARQAGDGSASRTVIDACEVRVGTPEDVAAVSALLPPGPAVAFELPAAASGRVELVAAVKGAGASAKIRTGGTIPTAIPSIDTVAGFIRTCIAADVPFKATAGLHHPIRGRHRLTYEPDSPTAMMHGFLNVFLASAFAAAGLDHIEDILAETDAAQFRVEHEAIWWRDAHLTVAQIRHARATAAMSFGSCSFAEPVAGLEALGAHP